MSEKEVIVLTHQEAFNKAVRGMRDQGWKKAAMGGDWTGGTCKYRTNSGLKCAVGHIIPDDRYSPKMEGQEAVRAMAMANVTVDTYVSLNKLQDCHDGALDRLHMHGKFRAYAARWGLEFPADCLAPYPQEQEPA